MTDEIIVDVFNNNKLQWTQRFKSGRDCMCYAQRFIRVQLALGYTCIMSELQNGRPWCVIKYKPQS